MILPKLTGEYFEVSARPGERWDLLAYDYFGDVRLPTLVIQANFKPYLDDLSVPPLEIKAGTILRIPVIEDDDGVDENDLPPWKRENPDYET